MKRVPLDQVRERLLDYLSEAERERIIITENGKPVGVLSRLLPGDSDTGAQARDRVIPTIPGRKPDVENASDGSSLGDRKGDGNEGGKGIGFARVASKLNRADKETDQGYVDNCIEWEKGIRRDLLSRVVRWSIGVPLLVFSFPIPWFGPFLMLLGAILIAPDIAGYIAGFFGRVVWPTHAGDLKPIYGIPESLAAKGLYVEAEQEYEKIMEEFPAEVKPHVDMIDIAVTRLNDRELAEKLYMRGLEVLQDADGREQLTRMYSAIVSRLNSSLYRTRAVPVKMRKQH